MDHENIKNLTSKTLHRVAVTPLSPRVYTYIRRFISKTNTFDRVIRAYAVGGFGSKTYEPKTRFSYTQDPTTSGGTVILSIDECSVTHKVSVLYSPLRIGIGCETVVERLSNVRAKKIATAYEIEQQ